MASDRVMKILQAGYRKVRDMVDADRVYVALYDSRRKYLGFPLVESQDEGGGADQTKWDERPLYAPEQPANDGAQTLSPDWVIAERKAVLCDHVTPAELEAGRLAYWPGEPLPCAWLGVPLVAEDQILGALVVENRRQTGVFRPKEGLLTTVARSLAIAMTNARMSEQQERQIARLKALHDMGQRLTASIQLSEQEIIELIYEQASRVMDTKNMYIALYDETTDTVRFALAYHHDKRVDVEKEPNWQPRSGGQGRTEEIVRTRQPIFTALRAESEAWYREAGHKDYINQPFASWVGVPMIAGEKVLGVIATYHATREYEYDEIDLQTLTMLASQAAVAIENARLYAEVKERTRAWQQEQERADAAEKLALMSDVAAEFAHRMNNLAGTIPARVELAKENLDPSNSRDKRVIRQLDSIASDAKLLLDAAMEIKSSTESRAPEHVDIADALETAIGRVWSMKLEAVERIRVDKNVGTELPAIHVERNKLLDTLVNVVQNAVEAMPQGGILGVTAQQGSIDGKPCIEVIVSDTGQGISATDLPKVFDLFFTTKKTGLGFGLWRDRMFARKLGGDIEVRSTVGKGTAFTIKLPWPPAIALSKGGQDA